MTEHDSWIVSVVFVIVPFQVILFSGPLPTIVNLHLDRACTHTAVLQAKLQKMRLLAHSVAD